MVKMYTSLCDLSTKLIDSSNRTMFCLFNMPTDKYGEVTTRLMAWNKFVTLEQFLEKVLGLIKEDSLTAKFDLSLFVSSLKSIQDLQGTIEHKYIEKTSDEITSEEQNDEKLQGLSITQ